MTMRTILAEARAINTLAEPLSTFKMASPWRSDVGCLAVAKQKNPASPAGLSWEVRARRLIQELRRRERQSQMRIRRKRSIPYGH